ncbi:pantetheine-phosphate adenylyltransferase [Desulfogranum marinum]|jgi:pantetheine-phosphate adenylyltransferase|uniref:pantetheine-phosphate adenylyltransferase n=1 Tax=Desulfogranum marinum TaxID=453220 RepID=UPI00196286A0|nr:pantetheine-phosphate adenylyltransferase [Desulfogranum marinum]MBM9510878.1 pantetheine-phosphate adenylyltransferase [Desulfogranum marinum]
MSQEQHPQSKDRTSSSTVAVYPGTFDPITNGHIDIIKRGLQLFDKIIITIAVNSQKQPLFSLEERTLLIEQSFKDMDGRIAVDYTDGLIVDYAMQQNAATIIRGLRAISDFDYEFQLALMNRRLQRKVETVFLMTGFRWIYISSTSIKDAAKCQGNITGLVPEHVEKALKEKFS